jgi:hypothetical protein
VSTACANASTALQNAASNLSSARSAANAARQTYFTNPTQANLNAWNNAEATLDGATSSFTTALNNYVTECTCCK